MMIPAIATLSEAFDDASAHLGGTSDQSRPAAVLSWPTVPVEIVRAAALRAVVFRGSTTPTPLADHRLEPDAFPNRLRQLVEAMLAGRLEHAAGIILPRTSDPDYKAFLYLRELIRRGVAPPRQPIVLFDLLQSNGPEVRPYDAERTRDLFATLVTLCERRATVDDVHQAIARANGARAAARRLLDLRRGVPRVSGAEVLPLLGAFWHLPSGEYAALANDAADELSRRTPLERPRIALVGAPVDGPAIHAAIEAMGAVVVAESGPWGSDAPGEDVSTEGDPFVAIADRYRRTAIGPRTPVGAVEQRTRRTAAEVDAVVVLLPPEDTVFGWDYPALRAWLAARQVPHVCLTGDPSVPPGPHDQERLATLMAMVMPRAGVRLG